MKSFADTLNASLIGAWCPSLGPSGFRLLDKSPYNQHGTLLGMDPATDWVIDGGRYCLDFDGINDYVLATNPNSADSLAISASFWIKTSTTTRSGIVGKYLFTDGWCIDILATGVVRPLIERGGSSQWRDSVKVVNDGTWHHVVCTMQAGTVNEIKIWVDGITSQNTPTINGIVSEITSTADFWIARNIGGAFGAYLNGRMDDIRVFNRCISEPEVRFLASGRGVGLIPRRRRKTYAVNPGNGTKTINTTLTDFRYVRTTLYGRRSTASVKALAKVNGALRVGSPDSLGVLRDISLKIGVVKRTDSGTALVYAANTDGTFIPFNLSFVDVDSVVVSPDSNSDLRAVPSFNDAANPTGFYAYLYDANGARVDGRVRWNATGVIES